MKSQPVPYNKLHITIDEQISLLEQRGLIIENKRYAKDVLNNISYYRLAGYWWVFQSDKRQHQFKEGSTFEQSILLYNFDQHLRKLVFGYLEEIKIAIRTKLIYYFSLGFGAYWYQEESIFKSKKLKDLSVNKIIEEVKRSKEDFIKHHSDNYIVENDIFPSWKALEVISLGQLSRLFAGLKGGLKETKSIVSDFGLYNQDQLKSWLQALSELRNFCAHHSRLWNRKFSSVPMMLKVNSPNWITNLPLPVDKSKIYSLLC